MKLAVSNAISEHNSYRRAIFYLLFDFFLLNQTMSIHFRLRILALKANKY